MNVELLLKVKKAILLAPDKYEQGEWCGTACCIGGHAVAIAEPLTYAKALNRRDAGYSNALFLFDAAKRLLDMDPYALEELCSSGENWPAPFAADFDGAATAEERAIVASACIDHFIATGGAQ